ncbi:MAG: WG repeat-containing protein [Planctomycetota bacterium]
MTLRLNESEIVRPVVLSVAILATLHFAGSIYKWTTMVVGMLRLLRIGMDWVMLLHAVPAVAFCCASVAAFVFVAKKKIRLAALTLVFVLAGSVSWFLIETGYRLYQHYPDAYFTWWWYHELKKAQEQKPHKVRYKYGYIDKTGTFVVKPQFDEASRFSEGLACVGIRKSPDQIGGRVRKSEIIFSSGVHVEYGQDDSTYGYVDESGQIVITPMFGQAGDFAEGLARVRIGEKYGYVDKTGKIVIEPQFDYRATHFSEGMATIAIGDKYGFIDKTGQTVIKVQFDCADRFSYGLAAVKIGRKWGYINKAGQVAVERRFDFAYSFREELAAVQIKDRWGYIDRKGSFVVEPQFLNAGPFSDGLANVEVNDKRHFKQKWGFIDTAGGVVIEPRFSGHGHFSEGIGRVAYIRGWGYRQKYIREYIDKTGRHIMKPQFDWSGAFCEGLAGVVIDKKFGYMDKTRQIVIEPQFDIAHAFSEGLACVGMRVDD